MLQACILLIKGATNHNSELNLSLYQHSSYTNLYLLSQWKEFLLFAGLLLGVFIIFSIMAYFYTYVDPDQLDKIYQEDSGKEEDNDDDTKKKTDDIHLEKTGKSTRL